MPCTCICLTLPLESFEMMITLARTMHTYLDIKQSLEDVINVLCKAIKKNKKLHGNAEVLVRNNDTDHKLSQG